MERADASCCLRNLGSVETPRCRILEQKGQLVGTKQTVSMSNVDCSGRSIVEMLEDELDAVIDQLMEAGSEATEGEKGRAMGLSTAIAIIRNPYAPNVRSAKAQAMARWDSRQAASGVDLSHDQAESGA